MHPVGRVAVAPSNRGIGKSRVWRRMTLCFGQSSTRLVSVIITCTVLVLPPEHKKRRVIIGYNNFFL